ncbi:MAG: hypothetical protein IT561_27350 [Alphaproteobacteria bacterium]|nr:hypothetical protein [Alphaproteobacteria bacterium]
MLAVASWLRRMPSASRPRLAALIHEGHGLFAPPGHPPTVDQAAIMLGVSALTSVAPVHRLLVAATSDELADATARALGRPVPVVPVANPVSRLAPAVPAERRTTPSGAIRVALPGVPRPGKNARLLPAVIAAIRTAAADACILAQVGAKHAPDGDDAMVDLRPGALAEDDYRDMLTNAAIAVLPYDRAHYRARVSGIFVEAAAAGCVMVVPAGTWMADQLEAGRAAGIVVGDPTPDAIAAAVARAIAELPALSATALAKSAQWREGYGPGPFIARIEELMDGPTGGGPASSA